MIEKMEVIWRQGDEEGTIPVNVVYSSRKSLGLEIREGGREPARVPLRTSNIQVRNFIQQRSPWIVEKWFIMNQREEEKRNRPQPDYVKDPGLERSYREQAARILGERTAYFAQLMGVTYGKITIRAAKTRWGSCSAKGNLNFHWKLVLMPPEVLDYVIVHELAHRREMNHSPRFWAEVEHVLPDYRERRRWLKENGGLV